LGEQICHELAPLRRMSIMFCGQKSLLMGPSLSKCNTATNISINIDKR
jgi:hypothetical protein